MSARMRTAICTTPFPGNPETSYRISLCPLHEMTEIGGLGASVYVHLLRHSPSSGKSRIAIGHQVMHGIGFGVTDCLCTSIYYLVTINWASIGGSYLQGVILGSTAYLKSELECITILVSAGLLYKWMFLHSISSSPGSMAF